MFLEFAVVIISVNTLSAQSLPKIEPLIFAEALDRALALQ